MRFIFIFIDGVGIGKSNGNNPFLSADPGILRLWEGSVYDNNGITLKPIDPLLGIPGIPQSATGQTTIFTGINIPGLLSKHIGSFPNKLMRKVIREENLLLKIDNSGKKVKFVNAYPHHSEIFSGIPELFESEFRILAFTLLNGVCDREIRNSACCNAPGYGERLISLRIETVITFYLGVAAV